MKGPVRWLTKGFAFLVFVLAFLGVLAWAVMLLWNELLPGLLHLPTIGFEQALGLLLLARILVGGRGWGWHGGWRSRLWREHWAQMTPEERARLRERFLERCGHRMGMESGGAEAQRGASPP